MATETKELVYSRPNARFDGEGILEVRDSASGNCRRALWYEATGYDVTNPRTEESLTVLEAGNALEPGCCGRWRGPVGRLPPPTPTTPSRFPCASTPTCWSPATQTPLESCPSSETSPDHRGQDPGAGSLQAVANVGRGT